MGTTRASVGVLTGPGAGAGLVFWVERQERRAGVGGLDRAGNRVDERGHKRHIAHGGLPQHVFPRRRERAEVPGKHRRDRLILSLFVPSRFNPCLCFYTGDLRRMVWDQFSVRWSGALFTYASASDVLAKFRPDRTKWSPSRPHSDATEICDSV